MLPLNQSVFTVLPEYILLTLSITALLFETIVQIAGNWPGFEMSQSPNKRVERFPNDPIFNQLAFLAAKVRRPVVYDATGLEADYNQFFHDVSKLRAKLREVLPSFSFDEQGILYEKHPYICLLATGDYDFIVSFYAILALGGAIAPLGKSARNEFSFDKIQNTDAIVSLASGPPS